MLIDISQKEATTVRRALESYLSELRHEIVKTEQHDWKVGLHEEEEILKRLIGDLSEDETSGSEGC